MSERVPFTRMRCRKLARPDTRREKCTRIECVSAAILRLTADQGPKSSKYTDLGTWRCLAASSMQKLYSVLHMVIP